MLDFAPNLTWRYRVKYHSNGLNHDILIRTGEDSPATVGADLFLAEFLPTINEWLPTDFALLGAEECAPNSELFLPSVPPAAGLLEPLGTPSREAGANYFSFSGKGNDGTQYKFTIYGVTMVPAQVVGKNYRLEYGDDGSMNSALDVLAGSANWAQATTVSGRLVHFRNYANYGVSAYWARKLR